MSHSRHIIFSLFCIFQVSLSTDSEMQNKNRNNPIKLTPLYTSEIPQTIREAKNNERLKQQSEQAQETEDTFSEEDIEEMELVLEHSPAEAQYIINHLQDPTLFPGNLGYRSTFFVGKPGSGKTMTARAIAYKVAPEWECKFLSSISLLGEYRNQTAIHLKKELEAIASSGKPTIIVVDELHRLLENAESKHHDTDTAATALWLFLDKHEKNKKIFFIGIMNRITKLPQPFKDRILSDYITFQPINDSTIKKNIVRRHLAIEHINFDPEVTDDFLCAELERLGPCFGRQLKKLSRDIYRIHLMDNADKTSMPKKTSVTKAVNGRIFKKEEIQYNLEEETDEQRQERFHRESIILQQKHHTENQNLQQKIAHEQSDLQKIALATSIFSICREPLTEYIVKAATFITRVIVGK